MFRRPLQLNWSSQILHFEQESNQKSTMRLLEPAVRSLVVSPVASLHHRQQSLEYSPPCLGVQSEDLPVEALECVANQQSLFCLVAVGWTLTSAAENSRLNSVLHGDLSFNLTRLRATTLVVPFNPTTDALTDSLFSARAWAMFSEIKDLSAISQVGLGQLTGHLLRTQGIESQSLGTACYRIACYSSVCVWSGEVCSCALAFIGIMIISELCATFIRVKISVMLAPANVAATRSRAHLRIVTQA